MQFDPRSATGSRDIKGRYTVTLKAKDKVSKAGNDMIEVEMRLGPSGRRAWDFLGEWDVDKIKEAAGACGLLDKFNTGQLSAADFDGVTVDVMVAPDAKDPERIAVKRYLPSIPGRQPQNDPGPGPTPGAPPADESDLPF